MVRKGPRWDEGREALGRLSPAELAARGDLAEQGLIEVAELELAGEERPLQAELASFLDSVAAGRTPEVPGDDGRRALELADRIAAAIREQAW
jgi:predicted dehydrogenase